MQYRAIVLAMISLLLVAALASAGAAVYAAEPTIKQGRQIVRSADQPIIITGPINPGPSGGGPPGCVEPLGCPPPPRDNAIVSIPNLRIQTADPLPSEPEDEQQEQQQQQLQVQMPGQTIVTPPDEDLDKQHCIGCEPDDQNNDAQVVQQKDDGNN